ncbi:MAG: DNA polymerase III subunit chi [Thiohalospira sp.]
MTRVDFYILAGTEPRERDFFTCRLVEKAWRHGMRVWLHCADADDVARMDELLWTFRPGSFIPHEPAAGAGADAPVLLGHGREPEADAVFPMLINRATEPPLFFSRFERLAEVVDQRPDVRDAGRARWAFYRDRGYPLNHHDMRANAS